MPVIKESTGLTAISASLAMGRKPGFSRREKKSFSDAYSRTCFSASSTRIPYVRANQGISLRLTLDLAKEPVSREIDLREDSSVSNRKKRFAIGAIHLFPSDVGANTIYIYYHSAFHLSPSGFIQLRVNS
jgi:hypothetical protein